MPKGTKRVGSLVPVENNKKGVTLAVTASLLSSQLLPPFIIDTGSFGADLMTSWSNCTKSTVIFNKSHWMTQYAFIIYLYWLLKMFPSQRSLLIVDQSKTHFGKIITDFIDAKAKELSCTCVVLDAFTGNFPAHRFYYNQGYEPRGFHFIKTIDENGFS